MGDKVGWGVYKVGEVTYKLAKPGMELTKKLPLVPAPIRIGLGFGR